MLVADDDPAVAWFLSGLLKTVGAEVVEAYDGVSALELARARWPDLVISDIVMPKLDGARLGRAIHKRFPRIKLLYVSGYTDDMLAGRGLRSEQVEFLAKPYTPASLTKAVARVLTGAG